MLQDILVQLVIRDLLEQLVLKAMQARQVSMVLLVRMESLDLVEKMVSLVHRAKQENKDRPDLVACVESAVTRVTRVSMDLVATTELLVCLVLKVRLDRLARLAKWASKANLEKKAMKVFKELPASLDAMECVAPRVCVVHRDQGAWNESCRALPAVKASRAPVARRDLQERPVTKE